MTYQIVLSDSDIQDIINGREVKRVLADGTEAVIRQSYLIDAATPVRNDRFQVTDKVVENHRQQFRDSMMQDTFRLGS